MSDETHGTHEPRENRGTGGWQPIPQSEGYDGDATAFVQLPPEFMLEGVPLEAPGHGYVPPMITPLVPLATQDPAATGTWMTQEPEREPGQAESGPGQGPGQGQAPAGAEQFGAGAPGAPGAPGTPGEFEAFQAFQGAQRFREGHGQGFREGPETQGSPESQGFQGSHGFPESHGFQGSQGSPESQGFQGSPEPQGFQEPHRYPEPQQPQRFPEAQGSRDSREFQEFPESQAFRESQESPQEQTASWTIPTIEDGSDVLDDSGEYTAARLAQYASGAPATLPGGAAAPWAMAEPAEHPVEPEPMERPTAPEAFVEPDPAAVEAPVEAPAEAAVEAPAEDPAEPEAAPASALTSLTPASAPTPPAEQAAPDVLAASLPVDMSTDSDEHPTTSYALRVNGADRPVTDSWIGESLLYVLRERLGLAGAKDGCSQGECGACNVQVDGRLVASCLVPAATAAGCEVRTVEGLAVDGEPSDVQRALAKCGVQCGFCIPGMAMTVHDLLEGNHAPNELETRQALCGNLCRCSGYRGVLDAVREVVSGREAAAEAEASGEEARIPHQIPHPYDGGTA